MKKFLLSLSAVLACASMSAKQVLSEIKFDIPEDGTVKAWAWHQSTSLTDGYTDETTGEWVAGTYDYRDASAYDYIAITFDETTTGTKFMVSRSDWNTRYEDVTTIAGQTLAVIPVKELGEWANDLICVILQPTGAGVLKVNELSYISEAEYQDMLAADAAKEKMTVKAEDVEVAEIGDWSQVGPWFGEENLDALYKTVVVELSCSAVTKVNLQTWPNGVVKSYVVAPSEEPVVIALPLAECETPGLGQVALSNVNYVDFLVDSISGMPHPVTGEASAVVKKIYYTSNEVASTYTEVAVKEAPMIAFDETMLTTVTDIKPLYESGLEGFTLAVTNTDSKISIDANNCFFGVTETKVTAEDGTEESVFSAVKEPTKFTHRMKTGGKSSSKTALTVNVPTDGVLTVYARSASGSATDRKVAFVQGGETLLEEMVFDGMAVEVVEGEGEEAKTTKVFPILSARVKAGEVSVTFPAGAINIYAFGFGSDYYVAPAEEPGDDPVIDEPVIEGDEIVIWEGEVTTSAWSAADLLTDGCPELTAQNIAVGDVVRLYITCTGTLNLQVVGGHWEKDEAEQLILLATAWSDPCTKEFVDVMVTEETFKILTTVQYWGSGFKINADDAVTCTKITLIHANEDAIESVEANEVKSSAIFNIAGQRVLNAKGLVVKNGKVILVK